MIKVNIISGFLGAGKTTFIKKLIHEMYSDQTVVVIENEFGQTGIDSEFLKETGVKVNELRAGCICCILAGEFRNAIAVIKDQFEPDVIIIEPTGVAELSDVINAVNSVDASQLHIDLLLTIVDAKKIAGYTESFGEFFADQIGHAQKVILSHTDGMSQDEIDASTGIIKSFSEDIEVLSCSWDELDMETLAEHHHHECHCHHCCDHDHDHHNHHDHDDHHDYGHHHHHAAQDFDSFGIETGSAFSRQSIEDVLQQLSDAEKYGRVLRAKGIVRSEDGEWLHFDYIPDKIDIRSGAPARTGLISVIGTDLVQEKLNTLFNI